MKIGILSMQKINNYGSLLQAYSLKLTLESFGCDVGFIDIVENPEDNFLCSELHYKPHNNKKKYTVDKWFLNRLINKINQQRIVKKMDTFRKTFLNSVDSSQKYDLVVIGSDEVFNCMGAGDGGFRSQLFGNIPNVNKIITYAASCGPTSISNLSEYYVDIIKRYFTKIHSFSVRDENTKDFVYALTGRKALTHLDPALIGDIDLNISNSRTPKLPKKYCVVYSYQNRFWKKEEYLSIVSFCKKNRMVPICLSNGQFWNRRLIPCDPFTCLKIIEGAYFVITDTFHGAIFSAKYAKRYAIVIRPTNYNKLNDLVYRIGIENHLVTDFDSLQNAFSVEDSKDLLMDKIHKAKNETYEYFKKYIK